MKRNLTTKSDTLTPTENSAPPSIKRTTRVTSVRLCLTAIGVLLLCSDFLLLKVHAEDVQECPAEGCPDDKKKEPEEQEEPLSLADKSFLKCCKLERRIPEACYDLCNYDKLTAEQLVTTFTMKECPFKAGEAILLCASSYKDHSECCKKAAVGEEEDSKHCLSFCNPAGGFPVMDLMETYKCLYKFAEIKQCFVEQFLPKEEQQDSDE